MNLITIVVVLALTSVLLGCTAESPSTGSTGEAGRFFSAERHRKNLEAQLTMCPDTISALRAAGVEAGRQLRLEYFFYSNQLAKVTALAEALRSKGNSADCGKAEGDDAVFLATGWTTKMPMDDATVLAWVRTMCDLGYEHDCEFDGWGTNPDQE